MGINAITSYTQINAANKRVKGLSRLYHHQKQTAAQSRHGMSAKELNQTMDFIK